MTQRLLAYRAPPPPPPPLVTVEQQGTRGMSWRIAIRHRTGYKYAEPVRACLPMKRG